MWNEYWFYPGKQSSRLIEYHIVYFCEMSTGSTQESCYNFFQKIKLYFEIYMYIPYISF